MARMQDPLLGSAQTGNVAEQAVRDAWRAFSGQGWTALLAEDRQDRGQVKGDEPPTALAPPPEERVEESQYGDFLGKVARARPRRPPPREA